MVNVSIRAVEISFVIVRHFLKDWSYWSNIGQVSNQQGESGLKYARLGSLAVFNAGCVLMFD